jgi:SAM-dependent methyltransferase
VVCRICGNGGKHEKYVVREMFFGTREVFEYFECSSCGCLQIGRIPCDMREFYPASYYSFDKIPEGSPSAEVRHYLRAKRDRYVLFGEGILGKFLQGIKPAGMTLSLIAKTGNLRKMSILDVGCGVGMMSHQLKEAGIEKVLGIDPFIKEAVRYSNGLEVLKKSLTELSEEVTEAFDLIMFNHSLEHIPDPVFTLQAAVTLLRSSGTILVRVPTVSSYAWRHYRTNWVSLDAPRHLFLYSVDSLHVLAKNAGLVIYDIVYDSHECQFWGSEQYRKNIPMESPLSYKNDPASSLFSKKDIASFKRRAADLNGQGLGDMAAFYLRKPE